ncbi:933_t:CDS:2 [Cetraspora pellucida]|uniref:933_t:CDS:1 n=1 Tax=Cetraspora pellucida TaxID=1433469 RepID=A0A9N9PAB1_9GLOM|nr:933_t:CDS:2 [Cetraspora pellucida]
MDPEPIPGLDVIIPLATIFSVLDATCLIYLLLRISIRWWTYTTIHRSTFQEESCKIIGGITFFLFSFNVALNGVLTLTTYLRICREIVIDLGIYDYKLFLSAILMSLTLTLIGINNYGQNLFWCFFNPTDKITSFITISSIILILLITIYCHIMTLLDVYVNIKRYGSKVSRVDIIVTRKITFYVLIVIFEWFPVVAFLISQINHSGSIAIYTAATLSVSFGGIGNTILYIIYENWKNKYSPSTSDESNDLNQNTNGSGNIRITKKIEVVSTDQTNENSSFANETGNDIN